MPAPDPRQLLIHLYHAAIAAVDSRRCVREALKDFPNNGPIDVIAFGKAAVGMAQGALDTLGDRIHRGFIVTTEGADFSSFDRRFECREGGHPLPTQASLDAGTRLIEFLQEPGGSKQLLFLISGGGSALVEVRASGISLDDLVRLNRWLLGSGLDIGAVNAVRKRVSKLKGGGLLSRLGTRHATALYISDVAGDRIADIASGPLGPVDPAPLPPLPDWIESLLAAVEPPEPPDNEPNIDRRIVARLSDAMQGAAAAARERGFEAFVHEERLGGEAAAAGKRIAEYLIKDAPPGIHIWGGETVVHLPPNPGRGGRCQTLALTAAIRLSGSFPSPSGRGARREGRNGGGSESAIDSIVLLAAGTDGIDGSGNAAGAIVDSCTIARAQATSENPTQALAGANAAAFLGTGGALLTGRPTGTNVADIVVAWKR